jgi:hypothetical protein
LRLAAHMTVGGLIFSRDFGVTDEAHPSVRLWRTLFGAGWLSRKVRMSTDGRATRYRNNPFGATFAYPRTGKSSVT